MRRLVATVVIASAGLLAGASITDARSAPAPSTTQLQRQMITLEGRFTSLQRQLQDVQARQTQTTVDDDVSARVSRLEARLSSTEQDVAGLRQKPAGATTTDLAAVARRVTTLESQIGLTLSFGTLTSRVDRLDRCISQIQVSGKAYC